MLKVYWPGTSFLAVSSSGNCFSVKHQRGPVRHTRLAENISLNDQKYLVIILQISGLQEAAAARKSVAFSAELLPVAASAEEEVER